MTRLLPALTAIVLLVSAGSSWSAAAFSLPPEKDRWIRAETAHFTLISNAAKERTTDIGLRLEAIREVLGRLLPKLQVDSPQPLWVFVFKDNSSFAPYKRRSGIAPDRMSGSFAKHRDANFLALNAGRPLDQWRVVQHEYFHYILSSNFMEIPLWFNEGTAECFSTFEIDEGRVEIGEPPDNYIHRLRKNSWIPFGELFRIDATSAEFHEIRMSMAFYVESWALAHYLLWGDARGSSSGIRFLERFPAGSGLDEALEPVIGTDWAGLESRVAEYVREGRLQTTRTVLKDLKIETSIRIDSMDRAEVLQRLGDFLARSDLGREDEAEAHFRESLRMDPRRTATYVGLAYVLDGRKRFDEAASLYERALALHSDDPMAHLYYGESLLKRDASTDPNRSAVGAATPPGIRLAREQFRKAIRLRPDMAEAYAGFGATYVREIGPNAEGIEALEKALSLLPGRSDVVLNLAALYASNGDRDRARAVMEPLLSRTKDPAEVARGREVLLQAEYAQGRALVLKGDSDRGLAIFRKVLTETHDPAVKDALTLQIAAVEKAAETNRQLDTYNQAVDLANRGSYRKAVALLETLLREATDPDVIKSARTLLRELRQLTE